MNIIVVHFLSNELVTKRTVIKDGQQWGFLASFLPFLWQLQRHNRQWWTSHVWSTKSLQSIENDCLIFHTILLILSWPRSLIPARRKKLLILSCNEHHYSVTNNWFEYLTSDRINEYQHGSKKKLVVTYDMRFEAAV